MSKYTPINGWTKRKMIAQINKEFKGKAFNRKKDMCQYLTPNGKKCAVGCFIPAADLEEKAGAMNACGSVSGLLNTFPELAKKLPLPKESLGYFQDLHDCSKSHTKAKLIKWIKENVE